VNSNGAASSSEITRSHRPCARRLEPPSSVVSRRR
jgi:hypothetical protein